MAAAIHLTPAAGSTLTTHEDSLLAVKSGRTIRETRVETIEVIRCADHENAVVVLNAVDLVQEVGTSFVVDNTVEILKDEQAG